MQSTESKTSLPRIAIIGAGKVGKTVGMLARDKFYPIAAIAGRDTAKLNEAARMLGGARICSPAEAAQAAEIVFLSVSDDAIEGVCSELASNSSFKKDQIVAHFSGALSSEVLATARDSCGALIASAHPLQTFSSVDSALQAMPGTYWFCEGNPLALATLTQLITSIGGLPRMIATEKKVLYHAASAIACNYLDTLMDLSLKVAEDADLDRDEAWQALLPLVQATLRNISNAGTTNALTGPISRGDVKTVSRHLEALSESNMQIAEIYKLLGIWTTGIASRKGLSDDLKEQLISILSNKK